MPYVGQTITDVFPTSISVDSATVSSTLGVTGETTLATHLNMGGKLTISTSDSGATPSVHSDDLFVEGSGNSGITIGSGTSGFGNLRFADSGGSDQGIVQYDHANDAMKFFSNGISRMETHSAGIQVNGRASILHDGASDFALYVHNDGNNANRYGIYVQIGEDAGSGTNYLMAFKDGDGSSVGSITFSGSNTSFNTSSDYRLKNNITDLTDVTAKLKELKPKKFSWKKDTNNTLIHGFLAHEVAEVIPEAVVGEKDAVDDDGKPIYQGIDHSKIVPLLTKALQEQQATIEALTARITALESA